MENWLQTLGRVLGNYSDWIEAFYRDHSGLVNLLVAVGTFVGLYCTLRASAKRKAKRPESSPGEFARSGILGDFRGYLTTLDCGSTREPSPNSTGSQCDAF